MQLSHLSLTAVLLLTALLSPITANVERSVLVPAQTYAGVCSQNSVVNVGFTLQAPMPGVTSAVIVAKSQYDQISGKPFGDATAMQLMVTNAKYTCTTQSGGASWNRLNRRSDDNQSVMAERHHGDGDFDHDNAEWNQWQQQQQQQWQQQNPNQQWPGTGNTEWQRQQWQQQNPNQQWPSQWGNNNGQWNQNGNTNGSSGVVPGVTGVITTCQMQNQALPQDTYCVLLGNGNNAQVNAQVSVYFAGSDNRESSDSVLVGNRQVSGAGTTAVSALSMVAAASIAAWMV